MSNGINVEALVDSEKDSAGSGSIINVAIKRNNNINASNAAYNII